MRFRLLSVSLVFILLGQQSFLMAEPEKEALDLWQRATVNEVRDFIDSSPTKGEKK